jgi:hypothetical protein
VLTGTMIIDGKATAFLRENAGGKSRRVAQGEQINGMLVAEVKPDRVKLTLGDEAEDLVLKVAIGPKTTDAAGHRTCAGHPAGRRRLAPARRSAQAPIRSPNAVARSWRPRQRQRRSSRRPAARAQCSARGCRHATNRHRRAGRRGTDGSALGRDRCAHTRQGPGGAGRRAIQITMRTAAAKFPLRYSTGDRASKAAKT